MSNTDPLMPWWHEDTPAEARGLLMVNHFKAIDNDQWYIHERNMQHAWLYEPSSAWGIGRDSRFALPRERPQGENAIEAIVETGTTLVAKNRVRGLLGTDNAAWEAQSQGEDAQRWLDSECLRLRADALWTEMIRHSNVFGLGLLEVYIGSDKRPAIDLVLADDIIVDESEARPGGRVTQMAKRVAVNKWQLVARFPKLKDKIMLAADQQQQLPMWTEYREVPRGCVMMLKGWHLPTLLGGDDGRVIEALADGTVLSDEKWESDRFPFVEMRWRPRLSGWYGIGLVESMTPMQERVNRHTWFKNRAEDLYAIPRVFFMSQRDASMAGKLDNGLGRVYVCPSGQAPFFSTPPPGAEKIYQRTDQLIQNMFFLSGVDPGSAGGTTKQGLESGEAIIQWRDLSTERHALPEFAAEQAKVDLCMLLLETAERCSKKFKSAPTTWRDSSSGNYKSIDWAALGIPYRNCHITLQPAAITDMTPAGKRQRIRNDVRDGLLQPDEIRQLNYQPDIISMEHFKNAPMESMRDLIIEVFKGNVVDVDPILAVYPGALEMARNAYLFVQQPKQKAPESVQEHMRVLVQQIEAYQKKAAQEMQAQMSMAQSGGQPPSTVAPPVESPEGQVLNPGQMM